MILLFQGQSMFAQGVEWFPHGMDSAFIAAAEDDRKLLAVVGAEWLESYSLMLDALEQDRDAGEASAAYLRESLAQLKRLARPIVPITELQPASSKPAKKRTKPASKNVAKAKAKPKKRR